MFAPLHSFLWIGQTFQLTFGIDDSRIVTFVNSEDGLGFTSADGRTGVDKWKTAPGSRQQTDGLLLWPAAPKRSHAALCCAGTRTLPHSAEWSGAVFHVTSERLQGTVRHIPQPPLCPQARVLVYIVAHRILYSYIVPIFRSRTLICKCFISPLYGRSFYFALINLLTWHL